VSAQPHAPERVVASSFVARTPLEGALGAAGVGYYEWDPSAGEAFVSESLTELFGLVAPETIASTTHWYDVIHPDDRSRYRATIERSVAASAGWKSEFRVVRPRDGSVAWVEERASVGSDDAARVRSVIGLVWDITARKRTEAALRESEERLRRILEIETIGVLFFNLDGRMTDANAAFARMTGYTHDELRALDWKVLTPAEWMPATERASSELSKAAETQPYVKELKRKDGSRFWALCGPRLLRGRGGDAVEFIVDITEAREARRALRVSEARFRTLVENILDYAIYAIDPRGVITDWTEGATRVMGYTADQALGSHISMFYPPQDVADGIVERQLSEAAKTGRSELETWKVRPDGTRFWANEITNSVRDANGNLTGFTRISRDLTAQRQAQEEKAAQYERERRGREAAEAFLAVMSHELRTPVTSIHGSAVLLARDPHRWPTW
jgi:PAS domain S-box-containing protein